MCLLLNFIFSLNVRYHNTGQVKPKKIARHAKLEIENGQGQNAEEIQFGNRVQGRHQVIHHQPTEVKMNHHINHLQGDLDTVRQNRKWKLLMYKNFLFNISITNKLFVTNFVAQCDVKKGETYVYFIFKLKTSIAKKRLWTYKIGWKCIIPKYYNGYSKQ